MCRWTFSVCDVLLEVAVRGALLSVLCGVGQAFPAGVFLTSHTVRASQLGQAFTRRPLLRVLWDVSVGPLRAGVVEVVAQVLQIHCPGSELLPVHPLERHDAVQVAAHLRARESLLVLSHTCLVEGQHWKQQMWGEEPFWFCAAGSPSLCDGCPGILGSVCWGQSQCPATWKEWFHVTQRNGERPLCGRHFHGNS